MRNGRPACDEEHERRRNGGRFSAMRRRLVATGALAALAAALAFYELTDVEDRSLDAAARAEAPGEHVRLSDGFTHYEVAGPDGAPVVVFAAGFSVPYYIWDPLFRTVADSGFRTIRYDYYGRGWSDRPKTE